MCKATFQLPMQFFERIRIKLLSVVFVSPCALATASLVRRRKFLGFFSSDFFLSAFLGAGLESELLDTCTGTSDIAEIDGIVN